MADCYEALFNNKWSCTSASVAITYPAGWQASFRVFMHYAFINVVAMPTGDALLRHFRKGMYHGGIYRQLRTLIYYVPLISCILWTT